jgi:hypothetical protein
MMVVREQRSIDLGHLVGFDFPEFPELLGLLKKDPDQCSQVRP